MIHFETSYAQLPESFFERILPIPVPAPELVQLNSTLAEELQLDTEWLRSSNGLAMLSGNQLPPSSVPIAQAYAGHQFGGWVPQLGDGRAVLMGEVIDVHGNRRDLQLKGSGRTRFSRQGDGRSTLGAVIREYVVSEAMTAMNVPSTRALAAVATGETVPRMKAHPGGILTRVAASHLRVGTFQYFLGRKDYDGIQTLANYAIDRHYPQARDTTDPYANLLERVAQQHARLIAQWMQLGFIHGVMNTDNTTISGETIDYGPCAFMEVFHPDTVFSSIDRQGRYAWSNQPNVGYWNLERLGEVLAVLMAEDPDDAHDEIENILKRFLDTFADEIFGGFAKKLGFSTANENVQDFVTKTLRFMAEQQLDFTLFFRHLTREADGNTGALHEQFGNADDLDTWLNDWRALNGGSDIDAMKARNPIRIPRNHRVEQAIEAAEAGDYAPFHELTAALAKPFAESTDFSAYEKPAEPDELVHQTFCGT